MDRESDGGDSQGPPPFAPHEDGDGATTAAPTATASQVSTASTASTMRTDDDDDDEETSDDNDDDDEEEILSYIPRDGINSLVMDFLIHEGFKDVAEKFSQEAAVPAPDLDRVDQRMKIRSAVQEGRIEDALGLVNDVKPRLLQDNRALYFSLRLQQFIEILRSQDTAMALEFAQVELAPLSEEIPQFSQELEEVMALLAFPPNDLATSPVGKLLDQQRRQQAATELNQHLLAEDGADRPGLPPALRLLQELKWLEDTLAIPPEERLDPDL